MLKRSVINSWDRFRDKVGAIIAVSKYGAREVEAALGVSSQIVFPIYHGTDHKIFRPEGGVHTMPHPYLLSVGGYLPIKNAERIYAAYMRLAAGERSCLVMVMPGYRGRSMRGKGVVINRTRMNHAELASWYRGALGLVFPSLRETFGFPILEAMACGCPVITSHTTGCPEVAGDAAILVDPRSVDQISHAMAKLIEETELRATLRMKGIAQSQQFTWKKSAQEHLTVFKRVLSS
jgi:glycosyltransferase involved in cell wall biosynthesis